jgi:ferredoxin-type protein NapF
MDRRAFFKRGLNKATKTAVKHAEAKVSKRAEHWIRPPFALDELEFLLACTRCGECLPACPHGIIFSLPVRLGAQVVGTPALDVLNKGCHLCEDWPCTEVCEPGALKRPAEKDGNAPTLPRLAKASIITHHCLPYSGPECGACAASCPVSDALIWDGVKPRIDPEHCIGCGLCRESCIMDPKAIDIQSLYRRS